MPLLNEQTLARFFQDGLKALQHVHKHGANSKMHDLRTRDLLNTPEKEKVRKMSERAMSHTTCHAAHPMLSMGNVQQLSRTSNFKAGAAALGAAPAEFDPGPSHPPQ
eukprot:6135774-Amphidinium_carterae.1